MFTFTETKSNARMIKIGNARFELDAIKSYSYDDKELIIETEEDFLTYTKDDDDLVKIVDALDKYLLINYDDPKDDYIIGKD